MSYKIAIASHDRYNTIQSKTLALLQKHNIPKDIIYIFVSPYSWDEYQPLSALGYNLIKGGDTVLKQRNSIIQHFYRKTKIVEMDDDIDDILTTMKGLTNKSVADLDALYTECFEMIEPKGLWGFNANTNNFFADGKDKYGLYSIINSCCGYINDKTIELTLKEKADFERTIIHYEKGNKVLKRCGYGIKTKYWTTKGGIQSLYDNEERIKVQNECGNKIMDKYGKYCYKKIRKNGMIDIRFKNQTKVPTLPPIDEE